MPSLMESILGQFDQNALGEMSRRLGAPPQTAGNAIAAAVPLLLSALSRNANSGGVDSLHNALSNDHDGSVLNNLAGFLGNSGSGDGAGILGHVFGNSQGGVVSALSQATGLAPSQMGQLLKLLAPVVMGFLGRQNMNQNLGASGLASLLGGEAQHYEQRAQPDFMSTISRFLDQNGDGSAVDELAGMLGGMLARR
jgi:hypothetical protein